MHSAFEKIKERLEELIGQTYNKAVDGDMEAGIKNMAYHRAKGIVNQVAEEYNDGWIPFSEPPKEDGMYLITANVLGKEEVQYSFYQTNIKMFICNGIPIAWQPLPKPYQQKGE